MDFGLPAAWPWGGTTRGATKENYYKYSRLCCLPGCLSSSVFNSQAYKDLGELVIEVKEIILEDKCQNSQFKVSEKRCGSFNGQERRDLVELRSNSIELIYL